VVFSFDALFGLTWRMLTPCLTLTSHLKILWSFGFWLVIPLYALVNNVLSLCMIMAVIALLVGCSQSFASLHLYWEGIILVHPTTKNQVYSKESTINFYAWYFQAIPSKFSCATFQKTFKILLILWHCFQLMGTYWSDLLSSILYYFKKRKKEK
jgi:hypothetical protein